MIDTAIMYSSFLQRALQENETRMDDTSTSIDDENQHSSSIQDSKNIYLFGIFGAIWICIFIQLLAMRRSNEQHQLLQVQRQRQRQEEDTEELLQQRREYLLKKFQKHDMSVTLVASHFHNHSDSSEEECDDDSKSSSSSFHDAIENCAVSSSDVDDENDNDEEDNDMHTAHDENEIDVDDDDDHPTLNDDEKNDSSQTHDIEMGQLVESSMEEVVSSPFGDNGDDDSHSNDHIASEDDNEDNTNNQHNTNKQSNNTNEQSNEKQCNTSSNKAKTSCLLFHHDNDCCPICLDTYQMNDTIITSKHCTHLFHQNCFMDYILQLSLKKDLNKRPVIRHAPCPCCRQDFLFAKNNRKQNSNDDETTATNNNNTEHMLEYGIMDAMT